RRFAGRRASRHRRRFAGHVGHLSRNGPRQDIDDTGRATHFLDRRRATCACSHEDLSASAPLRSVRRSHQSTRTVNEKRKTCHRNRWRHTLSSRKVTMSAVMPDFDTLAERADAYGALWARRTLDRVARGRLPPREWPGTMDEARRVVQTFAAQT